MTHDPETHFSLPDELVVFNETTPKNILLTKQIKYNLSPPCPPKHASNPELIHWFLKRTLKQNGKECTSSSWGCSEKASGKNKKEGQPLVELIVSCCYC